MVGVHLHSEKAGWLISYNISESHCLVSTTDLLMICVCVYNSALCIGTVISYLHHGLPSSPSAVRIVLLPINCVFPTARMKASETERVRRWRFGVMWLLNLALLFPFDVHPQFFSLTFPHSPHCPPPP